jgi:hypothetical protein
MDIAGIAGHPMPVQPRERDRFVAALLAMTWSHPEHAETCLLDWRIQCRGQ